MAYLLDADILIQAKDEYYGFDLCPGFWDWLDRGNARGWVFSVKAVGDELARGNDALAQWAKDRGDRFFIPVDERTVAPWQRWPAGYRQATFATMRNASS